MASENTDNNRWYEPRKNSAFKPPTPLQCYRCEINVYQAEKVGPVNGEVFHLACFNCCVCSAHLTMNNYRKNPNALAEKDKEIYCAGHVPKIIGKSARRDSLGITQALGAQQLKSLVIDKN